MTLFYQCDIGCDICHEIIERDKPMTPLGRDLAKEMKAEAKKGGWIRRRAKDGYMEDVCPKCQANLKAARTKP
jgi:hypothetical protein